MGAMRIWIIVFGLLLSLASPNSGAADQATPETSQKLEISSHSMEADGNLKQVVFTGEVVARQGGLLIQAAKLVISLDDAGKRMTRVEAFGSVRVEKEGHVATGEHGVYQVAEGSILLTGSPRVQQGENLVEGDEIVYSLKDNRSVVKSKAGSRVRAVLTPGEKSVGP